MLRRYTWESQKQKLQHYKRRQPETSVLYQIVYHSRDDLEYQWESRFQHEYGVLRDEVSKTLDKYLNCGILAHGAARAYCDSCKYSLLVAFSCKRRGVCPSCGAKRAVKFAEHIYNEVIENIPHPHTVFTIPKRLRVFFKYDRALLSILFKAAWGALSQILGVDERELAAIFTAQTAGEALNFHPHLHGLLADGYWKDNIFTRFSEIDLAALTQDLAEGVLAQLHKRELITDDDVAQILSQDHSGFGIWLGDPFHDKESEQFVARYIERGPLALDKISIQDDLVTYTTKDDVAHEFDALEFLATLSAHVPKPYESITRYYGRYSCRRRGERAKLAPDNEAEITESDYRREFRASSWAACIKRIYEIDPLECPKCKAQTCPAGA
jgi:Transposase zinc-binding domain/Putative transposase